MPTVTIAITSGTRWRVPADCSSATIEIIGAGGIGGGGYSKTNSIALTPLSFVYINIASGAQTLSAGQLGDTWFNKSANSAPTSTSDGCLAKGGNIAYTSATVLGGQSSGGVGDTKYSGGAGWGNTTSGVADSYGGAAGPNGNGGDGYQGAGKGGGGGANGGGAGQAQVGGSGGIGGTNRLGAGAGTAQGGGGSSGGGGGGKVGGGTAGAGSVDTIWTDYAGAVYGPAGGNGSTANAAFFYCCCGSAYIGYPNATNYGGGGLYGSTGLIIVTYTAVVTVGTTYTEVLNESFGTISFDRINGVWRVPYGVETVNAYAVGGSDYGTGNGGGGGGAWASSTNITVTENSSTYFNIPPRGLGTTDPTNNGGWFNKSTNSYPSVASNGVYAAHGNRSTGGSSASCVGVSAFSGGNGGAGTGTKGGGGGGAGGPNGAGGSGGAGVTGSSAGSGGGGGGANLGNSGNAGNGNTNGGAGGASGQSPPGTGGAGGVGTTPPTSGTNGSGAGGGRGSTASGGIFQNGASATMRSIYVDSGTAVGWGPGGGGGGAGYLNSFNAGRGGAGIAGGGPGGSGSGGPGQSGAAGLVVLQYTITKSVGGNTSNMLMFFQ